MAVFFYGYITLDGYLAAKDHNLDCPGCTAIQGDPAAFAAQLDANQNIWVIGGNTILAPLPPGKSPAVWPVCRAGLQERLTLFCTKIPLTKPIGCISGIFSDMRKPLCMLQSGCLSIVKRDINRTFSCSYGQLQTSACASGWG